MCRLSKKDLSDLEVVCNLGIEWLGLSFVQRAKDIKEAKKIVRGRAGILSKIETPSGVDAFDEILHYSIVKDNIIIEPGETNRMNTYYYWKDTFENDDDEHVYHILYELFIFFINL